MDLEELLQRSPAELKPKVDIDGVHIQVYGEVRTWTRALRTAVGIVCGLVFLVVGSLFAANGGVQLLGEFFTEFVMPAGLVPFLMASVWLRNWLAGTTLTLGHSEVVMRGRRIALRKLDVKVLGSGQARRLELEGEGERWFIEAKEPDKVLNWIRLVLAELRSQSPLPRERGGKVPAELRDLRGKTKEEP